ncbi:MAG TPA: hypothetical protein VLB46_20655 [Pyrinomonadaceae bacterium]|nr:hypothetical protein [Pyrinomonadaceae bacterium]
MNVLDFIGEGPTLLFILVLLYLSECVIWVKRESVAFVSAWGRRWRLAVPSSWMGNANGGLLFLNPLPPSGQVFLSHLSPISISPSGVCAFNLQTLPSEARSPYQSGQFLPFNKIKNAGSDGAYLVINSEKFTKCANAKQARALAKVIGGLVKSSTSKREGMARTWVGKQFAAEEAAAVLKRSEELIKPIQELGVILFLFLFVFTPSVAFAFGLSGLIIPVAAVMVVLAIQIAIMFHRAHRKLYPAESSERLESVVKMILCPPVSIRAADILTKNLLAEYSPIVLASVLPGSGEPQFVRSVILDLKHPLRHEVSEADAEKTITWTASEQLKVCLKDGRFLKPEALLAPSQREENSIAYCPRCRCQFVVADGECSDCPGVELVQF